MKPVRLLLALVLCAAAAPLRAASLVPIEGVYGIEVKNWKLRGEVDAFSGSQIVRLDRTCSDWEIAAQFRLIARSTVDRPVNVEIDLSATESLDGTRYRFRTESRLRGETMTRLVGTASRPAPGQAGKIVISEPERRTLALPPEAMFPTAATAWTIRQWEHGAKTANYVMFDGSVPEPVRAFELLTGRPGKPDPLPEGDARLFDAPAWRTSGSFHKYEGDDPEPLSTLTQTILSNGVATELALDIGFADVVLHLRRIRALALPKC